MYQKKTKNCGAIPNNPTKMKLIKMKILFLYTPISRLLQKMEDIITKQMENNRNNKLLTLTVCSTSQFNLLSILVLNSNILVSCLYILNQISMVAIGVIKCPHQLSMLKTLTRCKVFQMTSSILNSQPDYHHPYRHLLTQLKHLTKFRCKYHLMQVY